MHICLLLELLEENIQIQQHSPQVGRPVQN